MMEGFTLAHVLLIAVFVLGYAMIIVEHYTQINKTAVALFVAIILWSIQFIAGLQPTNLQLVELGDHVNHIAQIIFFLMGAMTIVEIVDSHKGFKILTDLVQTTSKRRLLVIVSLVTFFLSAVLDNLTTTILMVSLLRKLVPGKDDRVLLACLVVIAANAGGAWTPIGDVTTTMLWIDGQISSIAVMKALFLPSIVSLFIPLVWYWFSFKGRIRGGAETADYRPAPGAKLILSLGLLALIFVPIFKALTGLPPFMGVLIGLAVLWLVTDILHRGWEERAYLRVPHALSKIDTSGVLFFLGILLCVDALQTAGLLRALASWLDAVVPSQAFLATLIGILSAIIDNVPLVAATMGMYPLEQFPPDHTLWHMIAYAAGTGGSILIIGSAAGVAMMGMEKVDFITYIRKTTVPALLGFLGGMGIYLLLR